MKKLAIFIGKCVLAAACAIGLACVGMAWEWKFECILCVFLFGGIMCALCLGVFDIEDKPKDKHLSTKHGAQSMRPAA